MADSQKKTSVFKSRFAPFRSDEVEITVAYKEKQVSDWINTLNLKKRNRGGDGTPDLGFACYWREDHSNAHTLALCLDLQKVLVVDLEAVREIPNSLKALFKRSKVHGRKASVQLEKMAFMGLSFKSVEEVNVKFKNLVQDPQISNRDEAKKKDGELSDGAVYVAAYEAFGCFVNAK